MLKAWLCVRCFKSTREVHFFPLSFNWRRKAAEDMTVTVIPSEERQRWGRGGGKNWMANDGPRGAVAQNRDNKCSR